MSFEGEEIRNTERYPDHLEIVYGILFQPVPTLRRLAARPPMGLAVFIFAVAILISSVASLQGLPSGEGMDLSLRNFSGAGGVDPEMFTRWMAAFQSRLGMKLFPFQLLISAVWWILSAALVHLTAEALGGRGRALSLLALIGIVQLPAVLLAPAAILGRLISPLVVSLTTAGLSLWTLVLGILAIRENYGFSTGRAVGAMFLPVIGFFLAVFGGIVFLAAAIASVVGS